MILSHVILLSSLIKNQSTNYNTGTQIYSINKYSALQQTNQYLLASLKLSNSNNTGNQYHKIVYRSLWQKFLNTYLQEKLFLSSSNDTSAKYINKLKTMGLSVYSTSQYRKFLHKFNKNLVQNSLKVTSKNSLDFTNNSSDINNNLYLEYNWLKIFRPNLNNAFFPLLTRSVSLPTNNSLPLFILVNDNNEVVMSESTNLLSSPRHLNNRFFSIQSKRCFYTCLVFINHADALEYRDYINYQNINSSRRLNVKIVPTNMSLYNKLISDGKGAVDFRLIPDLKEISNLLHTYSKYHNVSFSTNQYYGNNFFQGQPLYQIRLNKKVKKFSNNSFCFLRKNKEYNYSNVLFLNYDTAIHAWNKLLKDNPKFGLPKNPQISVSNLELFIYNKKTEVDFQYFMFLPSLENYKFIKKYLFFNLSRYSNISYWIQHNSSYLKTVFYRVFWSLTSRQPSSW
uniref:Ycf80 n=1 Tax=Polysiphonia sertularioides TaxID=945028 RepID=A0A1Z1M9N5_9FLOR|nr:hypothetical protein [Polysiphonia sertularioides]ARW62454.1 hypothetical protein [Polysiphonia sertularioides]